MKIVFQYTVIAFFCCSFSLTVLAKQPTTLSATPVVVLFPYLADNPDFFELSATQKNRLHASDKKVVVRVRRSIRAF